MGSLNIEPTALTVPTPSAAVNNLSTLGFKKISSGVSLYTPPLSTISGPKPDSNSPSLIILCAWAFAQPKHLAKYLTAHQSLFPTSSILLIKNSISNVGWTPDSWQIHGFFAPAALTVQKHVSSQRSLSRDVKVLMHIFSNGGSHAAVQLSQACREVCGGMRLPCNAVMFDSCPGQPRFWRTIEALKQGFGKASWPVRVGGTVLSYVTVTGNLMLDLTGVGESAVWKLFRRLNDIGDVFLVRDRDGKRAGVPRCYLYSRSDEMIMAADVERHADIARERLRELGVEMAEVDRCVRLEEFVGTAHVNHMKEDRNSERYWRVVKEVWEETEASV